MGEAITKIELVSDGSYVVTSAGLDRTMTGEELVVYWNREVPPRSRVALRRTRDGEEEERETRGVAWLLLTDRRAVVMMHGRSGAHALEFVRPLADGETLERRPR